jgi:anti-sigma B factor antagonist
MATNPISIPELNLETVRTPEEIIVRCTGRITSATSAELQTSVRRLIPETKRVVLDLSNVSNMDRSGLGAIVSIYLSATRQRCGLKLIHLNQRVRDLFRLTKLAAVFEGHEDFPGVTPDK